MRKIFTLLILLLLLPVTALAVDMNTVYVGGVELAGSSTSIAYATTNENGEVITEGATADNYSIKWDGDTLTLKGAYITKEVSTPGLSSPVEGAAIGVYNQSGDANLTITLEGTNTIKDVSAAIHVFAPSDSASLTITGDGILSASSGFNPGIRVQSNTGNGTLAITGAKVTASSSYSGYGVQIRCGDNSNASLTVNGGSLTATGSGATFAGIIMQFGSSTSGSGTPTVTVSDNAIVRANGSAGGITSNSSAEVHTAAGTGESGGIVFDNGTGTVYGNVTLQEDITINQGESLTIRDGASLNTGNNKVTVNGGTLNGEDKITGTVKYTPSITTASLPEGKVNEEYATSLSANGSEPIEWSVTQGSLPTGLSLSKDGKITGKPTAPGDYVFAVTASNDVGSVSKELTITVKDVDPIYSIQNSGDISFADALEGYTPEVKTIMITNDGNQPITLDQPSSTSFDVGTLSKTELNVGETAEFTVQPKNGLLAGSYEEDIVITGTNNGKSVSTKVNVKFNVKHNAVKVERKEPICTEAGNIEYWYCEACRKYFQDEALTKELKQEETILPATGHNLTKVDEKKPTVDAAGNIEYWYCEVCNKYFSDEKAEHEITLEDTIIANFKVDTDINEFKKVLVDGKELKDTNYDIKSGSTILTLKPSFLDTLSAGKHKIRFEFNTGSVEAYFTVKDKENSIQTESANTGVQNKYGLWIVLLLVAAGGLAGFGILSKRRKNHK